MISLLVVNYRSAALTADAVRTARSATSSPLQVVIVDNSCDEREAEALLGIAETLIVSRTNRGYAGAINDGRRACSGETMVVSNPDVTFAPESIDRLADAIGGGTAVAGPAIFWDDAHRWRLPPGDLLTAPQKIDEVLASRSPAWREQWDRRRIRKRMAFWSLDATTAMDMLSGAVMAIRTEDFDAIGGFDERFALYFEETDFLRRVAARRRHIAYVPAARCRHIFNQSASQAGAVAAARYAESELKYLEKWNGPFVAQMLKRIERPMPPVILSEVEGSPELGRRSFDFAQDDILVEASPLATFATAAGRFASSGSAPASAAAMTPIDIPAEVRRSLRGEPLYLRVVVRRTAEVLATYKISP